MNFSEGDNVRVASGDYEGHEGYLAETRVDPIFGLVTYYVQVMDTPELRVSTPVQCDRIEAVAA